ncbi:MAG: hypothetical protein GVY19_07635 [Bacteroidetes bacterium]|nr:hypothetical protein [Bacteroidota bacterium]
MSKKLSLTAIIISLSVVAIVYFLLKLDGGQINEPVKAIPNDAIVLCQINKTETFFNELLNKNNNWHALSDFSGVNKINTHLLLLDSLIKTNPNIAKSFSNGPLIVSLHETGKAHFDLLASIQMPDNISGKRSILSIKNLFNENTTFRERKYENAIIHDWQSDVNSIRLSFSTKKGLLLLSTSPILLEDAIRQLNVETKLINQKSFRQIAATANKNAVGTMFVNFDNIHKLIEPLFINSEKKNLEKAGQLTRWMGLDIKIQESYILLSGYTKSSDSLNLFLDYFSQQPPQKSSIISLLPANTIFYSHFNFNDFDKYLAHLDTYNQEYGSLQAISQNLNHLNSSYNIDITAFMKANYDREGIMAFVQKDASSKSNDYLMLYKNKGNSQATEATEELITSIARSQNSSISNFKKQITIDASTRYTVYKLPFNTLSHYPMQPLFQKSNARYLVIYDNYFVFSADVSTLEHFLTSNIRRNHIYTKADYVKVNDFLPAKTNLSFYAEFPQVLYLLQNQLQTALFDTLTNNLVSLSNFGSVGASFYATNNMLNTNVFATQVPDVEKTNTTLWETLLDTVSTFKPAFVENHYNHENEIFLQDEKNIIYLINKAGRILWKLPLNEQITSEIYQIDYYKNGKLQLLFSTKNYLHLFDRLGNYVERYPVRLRSASDRGMSLFDYANNKNYRICVPGNDRNVYMYNQEGQLLKGWKFDGTDHSIITRVQHIRVKTNDYIVLADEKQTYILNRRGETRVNPEQQYALAGNPFYLSESQSINDSYLVTSDTSGAVVKFYLSGKSEREDILSTSVNHHYIYHDLNGNGSSEHIYLTNDALIALKPNGRSLFKYTIPAPTDYAPIIFDFGRMDQKIGLAFKSQNQLHLINNNGELYEGFPLEGCTPFSIGYLGNSQDIFNLIAPAGNNFLNNYAVH